MLTTFFAIRIGPRLLAAFAVSTSALISFFVPFPQHFSHPYLGNILTSVAVSVFISVLIGHAIYHLSRSTYFSRVALEEAKAEIEKERAKSEHLLLNILPESISERIYDLWGDTVNTASRMESHGLRGEIQVTRATYEKLKNEYVFEPRGPVQIKGKGTLETWLLKGKKVASASGYQRKAAG